MSASGLDADFRVSDPNPQEIEIKQAMATYAKQVILLADASKWGVVSLMQILPWRRVHTVVTEKSAIPPDWPSSLTAAERPDIIAV